MREYFKEKINILLLWLKDYFKQRIFGFSVLFIMYWLFIFPLKWLNLNALIIYIVVLLILFIWIVAYWINNIFLEKVDKNYWSNWEIDWESILQRANDFGREYSATIKKIGLWQNKYIILIIMFVLQYRYITTH